MFCFTMRPRFMTVAVKAMQKASTRNILSGTSFSDAKCAWKGPHNVLMLDVLTFDFKGT